MSGTDMDALLSEAATRLRTAGVESPRREARLLLGYVLGMRQEDIVAGKTSALMSEALARYEAALARRVGREPFAYIVGSREFWSLPFVVGPGVLIPRPESETLIEEVLRRFPSRDACLRIADLGTGSGCLLLALLSERPNAAGIGIDISQTALAFAARNAAALGLEKRAAFVCGDWLENISGAFDAILVNPPYIPSAELSELELEVARYEPRLALDGGPDGLAEYRRVAACLPAHLKPQGLAFFELGLGQAESVGAVLKQQGLAIEGTVCDLAGIPRCLVAGVRGPGSAPKKDLASEIRSG
ncbi:MAG TPA: peptide chain release factor N(5)-glutamine methyltransferase [Micropepsaceae bacterium]|nr:peptide chain release factor N(5)-glutamine methyltransferase [Micropepsaceae bacterium]